MQKRNKIALGIFAIFYLSFGALMALNQEDFIYQPSAQDFEICAGFANAQKVNHNGTRMYVKDGHEGTVVLYHGNAGSACDRAFYASQFIGAGYGYIFPEYAGYSNDSRDTTHELVKQDVQNVVDYLQTINQENVVVIGQSVGSGAASYHTYLANPNHLLLISPFASLADVAQRKFWFYPTSLLIDNAFDNELFLAEYGGSITIMHGDNDLVISQKSGLRLFESLTTKNKTFISIEGKGHNDLFTSEKSFETIQKVLKNQ